MFLTACKTTPAQIADTAIFCMKTMTTFPTMTTKIDAKMIDAGLKKPDVKIDAKRDAVTTPTKMVSTLDDDDDRMSSFGKSRLK